KVDLFPSRELGLLVERGRMQHRYLLTDAVAGKQSNVFVGHALVVKLCSDGVPERVQPDSLSETQALQVGAELVERRLAVALVRFTRVAVHAGGQVGEQSRMATRADILHEIQEARIKHLGRDGEGSNG